MNIIVCIKQVPSTSDVKIDEKTGSLIRDGVESKMNPYDLFALETALQMKQQVGANITVLSMGPPQVQDIINEAYLMGDVEGAILSDRCMAGADCLATSFALSQCIQRIGLPDLVICGKQTTDGDTAQVGAEIAEFLHIPHITNVLKIDDIKEKSIIVESDLPDITQTVELQFPALISVEKDIVQPRLPSYKRKRSLPSLHVRSFNRNDLADKDEEKYGLNGSPTRVVRIFPPEKTRKTELVQGNSTELADKFYETLAEWKFV
ncbi:MAG TPA: electron transfer flavoprotein subunit beta [Anaerolineaceae bacterium]|nr:electron transfer flavoprotein subunit beta [Anaerolineaceae bacterium]